MNMPSHHQSSYFQALSAQTKLNIYYTGKQHNRRKKLGWKLPELQEFEHYSTFLLTQLYILINNRNSVHIITGCSSLSNIFIWLFCLLFKINWYHLSENIPAPSNRSFLKNIIVKWYYASINCRALAAFAIGNKAKRSFEMMGVCPSKIFITNYSSAINNKITIKSSVSSPLKALILGELNYQKGTDIALDVIQDFSNDLIVDFIGSVQPENQIYADQIRKISNATYQGVIPSDKVEQLWAQYDLLIFPSRIDGWGMAVHEAIANNIPVLCSNAAGASEHLIINQYNGSIVEPDKTSFKEALDLYINNPQLLIEQSENCAIHKMHFSPLVTAKRFVRDIKSTLPRADNGV